MAALELRDFTPADLPALRDLWVAVNGAARSEQYDSWRFLDTPLGPMWTSLAMDGDRCAGSYTLAPTRMNIGGEAVLGAQSLDTMTHPEFRGQGLFVRLANHCYARAAAQGCEMVYGFPNENSHPGFIRRLNFQHVSDVARWVRPLGGAAGGGSRGLLRSIAARFLPLGAEAPGLSVGAGRPGDDELAALVAAAVPVKDICRIDRGKAWFDHRYAPAAGWNYEWLAARDGGGALAGAAIWRIEPGGGHGWLLELIGGDAARGHLLRQILLAAKARGAAGIGAMGDDPDLLASLKAAGFVRRPPFHFIVRTFASRTFKANPHSPPAWRLVTGDFDTV